MDQAILNTLKPVDGTSQAIRQAIARAVEAREASVGKAAALNTRLIAEALTLTSAARRAIGDEAHDTGLDVTQLDTIISQLEDRLEAALAAEKAKAEEEAQATLMARIAKHTAEWGKHYTAAAVTIRKLVDERLSILADARAHNDTVAKSRFGLGVQADHLAPMAYELNLPLSEEERENDIMAERNWYANVYPGNEKVAAGRAMKEGKFAPKDIILTLRRHR